MNKVTKCWMCHDTGIYFRPNGKDDYDKDFCSCPAGVALENESVTA